MIDRELLRQAWPAGYLLVRGVATTGRWTVVRANGNGISWTLCSPHNSVSFIYPRRTDSMRWSDSGGGYERIQTAYKAGDLLPTVDPSDVATWAAVKADLAQAHRDPKSPNLEGSVYCGDATWTRRTNHSMSCFFWELQSWWLYHSGERCCNTLNLYDIGSDEDNPGLALVRARIKVRKETGR